MLQFFHYQYAGTFTHYKTITFFIVRTARCFGIVVTFTQGFHGIETTYAGFADNTFSATGDDNVCFAKPNEVKRIHNSVGRGGTGAYYGKIRATKAMPH